MSLNVKKSVSNIISVSCTMFCYDLPQLLSEIRLQLPQPEAQKGYDFLFQKSELIAKGPIFI